MTQLNNDATLNIPFLELPKEVIHKVPRYLLRLRDVTAIARVGNRLREFTYSLQFRALTCGDEEVRPLCYYQIFPRRASPIQRLAIENFRCPQAVLSRRILSHLRLLTLELIYTKTCSNPLVVNMNYESVSVYIHKDTLQGLEVFFNHYDSCVFSCTQGSRSIRR